MNAKEKSLPTFNSPLSPVTGKHLGLKNHTEDLTISNSLLKKPEPGEELVEK